MLISFDGKGCTNCPFYRSITTYHHECWLHGKFDCGDLEIKINDDRNLQIAIEGPPKHWPKGCPFGEPVGSLQITAQEGSC